MSKFKLGEKVLANTSIVDNKGVAFLVKGQEYIVDGFTCCPGCGDPCIYLIGHNSIVTMQHDKCGSEQKSKRVYYKEDNFDKAISFSDATEYRLRVSIPELTEIKEVQHQ